MAFHCCSTIHGLNIKRKQLREVKLAQYSINIDDADTLLHLRSDGADTVAVQTWETTGTNGASMTRSTGDQDPNGVVTGAGGNEHFRAAGDVSASFESLEATTGTEWFKRDVSPTNRIIINTSAEFEALDIGATGTITISTNTTIVMNTSVTTSTVFSVTDTSLEIQRGVIAGQLISTTTGTMFTGVNSDLVLNGLNIVSTAGGTLLDWQNSGFLNVGFRNNSVFIGWSGGTYTRSGLAELGGAFQIRDCAFINWTGGFFVEDVFTTIKNIQMAQLSGGSASEPFFDITSHTEAAPDYLFSGIQGTTEADEAFIRIDAGMARDPHIQINGSTLNFAGSFYDTSGIAPTAFTAVAQNNIVTTVTSVVDNTVARFTHGGTSPFVGSLVTLTGFSESTYNVTGRVTANAATWFEIDFVAFVADDSGTSTMTGVTITSASHGLSNGTGVAILTDDATDYDGSFPIYNVTTNTFDVSATFTQTETGTWSTEGLDQTNPIVLGVNNLDQTDSKYITTAFVNNNATANGAIVNNTFTDMVFGTGGSALVQGTTIERFKLVDEITVRAVYFDYVASGRVGALGGCLPRAD